jgi:tRNA A-37 threonylcarbamoyl transferase component Bud32
MTDYRALIAKPTDFKVEDEELTSSNNVYQVHFGTGDYVIKNPGRWSDVLDWYYCKQDARFYGNRCHAPAKLRLDQEKKTLEELGKIEGVNVPTVAHYEHGKKILVLDYIPGRDFRNLDREEKRSTLEGAMEQLELIHSKGKFIGNTHTKKIRLGDDGNVYWVGFCGLYKEDQECVERSQAIDLLKFAYSTFMSSGKKVSGEKQDLAIVQDLTIYAAALASQHNNDEVRQQLRGVSSLVPKGLKLKWTTRMSLDGKFSEKIKNILYDQRTLIPGPFGKLT